MKQSERMSRFEDDQDAPDAINADPDLLHSSGRHPVHDEYPEEPGRDGE